jgi:hypothetical protein
VNAAKQVERMTRDIEDLLSRYSDMAREMVGMVKAPR